jgi:hypothetical protein
MKKTDKEDSLKMARMLDQFHEEQLPWVPLPNDRDIRRRKLIAGYAQAVKLRA